MLGTDHEFYIYEYGGKHTAAAMAPLLKRADTLVYSVCRDNISSDEDIYACRFAACIQAEFMLPPGADSDYSAAGDRKAVYSSVKLGDFSAQIGGVSGNSHSQSAYGSLMGLCPEAVMFLGKRGLLYRGGVNT